MANNKGTYLRNAIYNAIWKNTAFTGPATVYMSLHTGAVGLTGANECAVANGYARQAVALTAPTGGAGSNSAQPSFGPPTPANWGTITDVGYWDAASGGNFLEGGALSVAIVSQVGVPINFPVGQLTMAET